MGRDNPDLVRAAAGLAQGVGCGGEICGALSGAVCLIAMHTAKGADNEDPLPESVPLMSALVDWFRAEMCNGGAITCDAILGLDGKSCGAMDPQRCGDLVTAAYTKALELLVEYGIDPTEGRVENTPF
jgi:hypothetical protein